MAPACHVFPSSELEAQVQVAGDGRVRKGGRIDLSACELFSIVQYECQIDRPDISDSPVRCWPVQRWCQDRKGTFMVETTAWEGTKARKEVESSQSGGVKA
ncbi:hypothetical protein GGR52DRAFT_577344 [Hypoxylon sp. FL1284]|nr:hypothetical protein GGR52DRAFT_577344 [Hypoxylon sp. FL1284]